MPQDDLDPGASTQMFQAFVDRPEPEASRSGWLWAVPAVPAVAALVIVLVAVWLVLGS